MEASLTDRARALAADAERELDQLERRKQETLEAREAEVAEVRERYRQRIDEIEQEIALTNRLRKALDPKRAQALGEAARHARQQRGVKGRPWRPSPETFATVLSAMTEGRETIAEISEAPGVTVSSATVRQVVDVARSDGWVRLAGKTPGRSQAYRYRLTPQGQEHAQAAMNGSHVGADT